MSFDHLNNMVTPWRPDTSPSVLTQVTIRLTKSTPTPSMFTYNFLPHCREDPDRIGHYPLLVFKGVSMRFYLGATSD